MLAHLFCNIPVSECSGGANGTESVASYPDSAYQIWSHGSRGKLGKLEWYLGLSNIYWSLYITISMLGMGNISILSYIVILKAHDNRIMVVLQLSSYRLRIISGAFA